MPAQPNQSLISGISCLQAVLGRPCPVGVRELARELAMDPTKVGRLLGTLGDLGLVVQNEASKYIPGPAVHVLSAQVLQGSGLLNAALPQLMALRAEGFTVALGVLWRSWVCYMLHERPWQDITQAIGLHNLHPAELSSIGLALLAARPGDVPRPASPEGKPITKARLQPGTEDWTLAVSETRRLGYAIRRFTTGDISIGVAIGQPPIAGIAVSAKYLGEQYIPDIAAKLREAAGQIAQRLATRPQKPRPHAAPDST